MQIHHGDRLLVAALGGPHRCLSSAMRHGGLAVATQVAWVQVHNTDLPIGVDPFDVMDARLRAGGVVDAVGLMTSRSLEHFLTARRIVDDVQVDVLATVGLSNALRIGDLPGFIGSPPGTINVLARLSVPLTDAALVEAIAMAAEARTAAVREANVPSRRSGAPSTGTGTERRARTLMVPGGDPMKPGRSPIR
ncbi:MAG: adenosylcobinamide amidohydrolase, partial [Myxococcota bacterium]